jgi:hypothetical protein
MTYKIVPQEAKTFTAEDIVNDVSLGFDGQYVYYVFLSKHTQYADNSDAVILPVDSEVSKRQVYADMLFGKRVSFGDAKVMVNRYNYVANTLYAMYDDADDNLFSKNFFITVPRGTAHDVFKCLYNNRSVASTVAPDKNDITNFDEIYRTSDGYVWKYMYTIPYADMEKFATDSYIPVVANTSVSTAAVGGTIDSIIVESPGAKYDNNLEGTLGKNDLNIDGNSKKIDVSGNNKSSNMDDFYVGCIFKVVSGSGAGSYSKVASYDVAGSNRVITLSDILALDITSEYEITPEVMIEGDYTQTINAAARAVINSVANTIDYVEILNRGAGYKSATAYVYSNSVVPVSSNAVVRPVMSPYGGHGYDANNELGASRVCFSVTFNESSDSLPAVNDFRQVGVMIDPQYANVTVNFTSKDGTTFISGETAYQINPVRIFANSVSITTSANSVTASEAYFNQIAANTIIYLVSGSGDKQLARVLGVTNSTSLTIDTPGNFACNDCEMYLANVSNPTTVVNDLALAVAVSGVTRPYDSGANVVGYDSGASGTVDNMKVANTTSILNTFNQMWKYHVTTTDTFEEDEVVFQATSAANSHGSLFGIIEEDTANVMYLTNQFGYINTGDTVTGEESGDTAYVAFSYEPDLVYESGRIIYLENIEKVTRTTGQKETFKIIFSY